MTQQPPSQLASPEKPLRTVARPKAELRPKADVRPKTENQTKATAKPAVDAPQRAVMRPKVDVRPQAEVRPRAEVATSAATPKPTPRPKAVFDNPQTAAIARPPKTLPATPQKVVSVAAPTPRPQAQGGNVLYTRASVNLRQRANVSSAVMHMLKQGEAVRVFASEGKWRLVVAAGRKGWVHEDHLVRADPAAPRPKEALTPTPKTAASG